MDEATAPITAFDYRVPNTCEFDVGNPHAPDGYGACREPAMYWVWWEDDESDGMWMCKQHFDYTKTLEEAADG